jgi:hypothetical protein
MNTTLILLFIVPIICGVISRVIWKHEIVIWEVVCIICIGIISTTSGWQLGVVSQVDDIEINNGYVTNKSKDMVSCSHSYDCNCRDKKTKDSKGKVTTTRVCDTCYEHSHDYDWNVETTVGDLEIDRVDRQGAKIPPRWNEVVVGEPASIEHHTDNYIKAVPDSIFMSNTVLAKDEHNVPEYPRVYDYYRVARVFDTHNIIPQDVKNQLNQQLNIILKTLGAEKQANVNIIFTQYDNTYQYSVQKKWNGGKKNDITILIGISEYPKVEWVEVLTWMQNIGNDKVRMLIQDGILDNNTLDINMLVPLIGKTIQMEFKRPHNKDYAYLLDQIEPPVWGIIMIILISCGISLWVGWKFSQNLSRDRY